MISLSRCKERDRVFCERSSAFSTRWDVDGEERAVMDSYTLATCMRNAQQCVEYVKKRGDSVNTVYICIVKVQLSIRSAVVMYS